MRISDWSSDVCSSDLRDRASPRAEALIGFVTSQDVDRLVAVEQRIEDRRIALATINNGERIIVGRTLADDDRARQRHSELAHQAVCTFERRLIDQIGKGSCRKSVVWYV